MFFIVYKTTNKINGKCYVGSHKTENINDGYLGSGKYLLRSIEKHGLENFVREILFQFDNSEDMYAKEAEIVNEDFLMNENTYNLKVGGYGGFDYINKTITSEQIQKRAHAGYKAAKLGTAEMQSKASKTKWANPETRKKMLNDGRHWIGRKHSEETKRKMRLSAKARCKIDGA